MTLNYNLTTKGNKLISSDVFRVLGELYQNVPKNHKYRLYILVLTLLACLGRRFSEAALSLNQEITHDQEGRAFIEYFQEKYLKVMYSPHVDTYIFQQQPYLLSPMF